MFERRVAGQPAPWTDDAILATFKFCNVYRAAVRVSQYMIRDVGFHDEDCTPQDRIFQIVVEYGVSIDLKRQPGTSWWRPWPTGAGLFRPCTIPLLLERPPYARRLGGRGSWSSLDGRQ